MIAYDCIGPYELRGELGRGAMARVWRAWDPNLRREVAIKEPVFDESLSPLVREELGRRFADEGAMAAQLMHPGIVTIFAADVWDGRPAIVMELVDGETLAQRLARGAMAPVEALDVVYQLLDAVGYAHERGVVHRDIKPDNIFLTQAGGVKLADFGIARSEGSRTTRGTVIGSMLGTPGYMSPEQALGNPVDARSDLFSVGVVAYEMLTGCNPFGASEGEDPTTLCYRTVHEKVPDLPACCANGLPVDVRPAIMSALSKRPEDRPQSAREFRALISGAMNPSTTVAEPDDRRMPSWLPYVIVGVAVLVVLGFVLMSAFGSDGSSGSSGGVQQEATPISSAYYLATSDGKVAIFSNSSATPYEVSDVKVTDLDEESAAALDDHVAADTLDEAHGLVDAYRQEADLIRSQREAELEAIKKAEEEAAEKVAAEKAEAEALAQAQAEADEEQEAEKQKLYPQTGGVNLRADPRHESDLVGRANDGDVLYYYGRIGKGNGSDGVLHDWYYVNIGGTDTWGWVRSDLVTSW